MHTSGYIEFPGAQLALPLNFTISMWLKPGNTHAAWGTILDKSILALPVGNHPAGFCI